MMKNANYRALWRLTLPEAMLNNGGVVLGVCRMDLLFIYSHALVMICKWWSILRPRCYGYLSKICKYSEPHIVEVLRLAGLFGSKF